MGGATATGRRTLDVREGVHYHRNMCVRVVIGV